MSVKRIQIEVGRLLVRKGKVTMMRKEKRARIAGYQMDTEHGDLDRLTED
jgi:hypothetical protein